MGNPTEQVLALAAAADVYLQRGNYDAALAAQDKQIEIMLEAVGIGPAKVQ